MSRQVILAPTVFCLLLAYVIAKDQSGNCRTCDIIMNLALLHFRNNVTDKAALKTQLEHECSELVTSSEQLHCTVFVDLQIDKIFSDLQQGKSGHQTCVDVHECLFKNAVCAERHPV